MSLLSWWLDAGVDVGISEAPRNWLTPPAPPMRAMATEGAQQPASGEASTIAPHPTSGPVTQLPEGAARPLSLDAFHAWLAESATLPLFRAGAARALPHGPAEAEVMLLTGVPGPEDTAEGKPIGGPAHALVVRMLAAIGLSPEQAYVAALACFAGAGSRLSPSELASCRDNLLHQIDLVRPRRLLLLGDEPASLLLDLRLLQARGKVHRIHGIPAVVTFHPRHLLERTGDKALAWRDLLLLMGENP
jgi:DNA polymerase